MTRQQLKAIPLERHARQLRHALPGVISLSVYDNCGELVYGDLPANGFELQQVDGRQADSPLYYEELPDENGSRATVRVELRNLSEHIFAYLNLDIEAPEICREKLLAAVNDFSDTITEYFNLNDELDSMASELGRRYEELNLVYQTKTRADNDDDALHTGTDVLNNMVCDCATFMNVNYASMWLPDKHIFIEHHRDESAAEIPRSTVESCLAAVRSGKRAIVINRPADAMRHGIHDVDSCRLICVPVFAGNVDVDGLFIVMRKHDEDEFSNSDRQLIEMQAEVARKVLQNRYDSLTGLMNRSGFDRQLSRILEDGGHGHTLLLFNLDQFKIVNDTCGHAVGNQLLRKLSNILSAEVSPPDLLARVGGDEFAVLLNDPDQNRYQTLCNRVLEAVDHYGRNQQLLPEHCNFSVNVGIVTYQAEFETPSDWMIAADMACLLAKDNAGSHQHRYQPDDKELDRRRDDMLWYGRVKRALAQQDLVLFCQPMSALNGGDRHYEVLMRVRDENGQMMAPSKFISAAERYRLMPTVDQWVVESTLRALAAADISSVAPDTLWSINLSGQSLGSGEFRQVLAEALQNNCQVDNRQICFEVTETAAIGQFDGAKALVDHIRSLGCRFSLDDFGSGLSSFYYLKEIPVDFLKIDGSFIKEIDKDQISYSMVKAMNSVGKLMGLQTIAEFVENETILAMLKAIDIDYAQGYVVAKPMPLQDVLLTFSNQPQKSCL